MAIEIKEKEGETSVGGAILLIASFNSSNCYWRFCLFTIFSFIQKRKKNI